MSACLIAGLEVQAHLSFYCCHFSSDQWKAGCGPSLLKVWSGAGPWEPVWDTGTKPTPHTPAVTAICPTGKCMSQSGAPCALGLLPCSAACLPTSGALPAPYCPPGGQSWQEGPPLGSPPLCSQWTSLLIAGPSLGLSWHLPRAVGVVVSATGSPECPDWNAPTDYYCSAVKSCLIFCNSLDCSTPGSLSFSIAQS